MAALGDRPLLIWSAAPTERRMPGPEPRARPPGHTERSGVTVLEARPVIALAGARFRRAEALATVLERSAARNDTRVLDPWARLASRASEAMGAGRTVP